MGYVRVKATLSNLGRTKSIKIELLADTGAIYTAIPQDIIEKLDIKARRKRIFRLANGERKEYPVGDAYIEIAGEVALSLVAFIPEGSTPLLGVTTLELLGFQVDPTTGELKPLELFLL